MSLDPTASEGKAANTANTPEVQSERPPVALRYFDRAELEETFAEFDRWTYFRWPNTAH